MGTSGAAVAAESGKPLAQIDQRVRIGLQFIKKGYIAQPFWSELKQIISIQKTSGFNRLKNEQKRRQALLAELEKRSLTEADYAEMVAKSKRPFHRVGGSEQGEIYIPGDNFQAYLANIAHRAPRAVAKVDPQNCRVAVEVEEPGLMTGKMEPDGIYSRFVKNEESNERMLAESPYIKDFVAKGTLVINTEMIDPKDLQRMVEYGGRWIGIGAARPMGFGRMVISEWTLL